MVNLVLGFVVGALVGGGVAFAILKAKPQRQQQFPPNQGYPPQQHGYPQPPPPQGPQPPQQPPRQW
ncbi:hypothetical protein [Umezawaea sp. Da 62-37]|uniref:hypothetical protein n=1 Tax=Umezawaea sp. Da 62-37 TaxID=3075927 RepID=UPI0028F6DC43|nr:hypothetical protein [Umezawaea sp. Da 62-37]WNV90848.1 hypothetical protein RM788_21980 [Umezawaea sp. Da 62-37]